MHCRRFHEISKKEFLEKGTFYGFAKLVRKDQVVDDGAPKNHKNQKHRDTKKNQKYHK